MNLIWQVVGSKFKKLFFRFVFYPFCRLLLLISAPLRALKRRRFLSFKEAPATVLLVFFGRGLGDSLLFTGILESVRKRYPKAELRLATFSQMESYFRDNPFVDVLIPCPDYFGKGVLGCARFLSSALEACKKGPVDLLIDLLPNRDLGSVLWSLIAAKRYSVGVGDPPKQLFYDLPVSIDWKRHYFEALRDAVRPLGIEIGRPSFWLPPEVSLEELVDRELALAKCILVAPGGKRNVEAPKDYCWSFGGFTEVVESLLGEGQRVILLGADYDRDCLKSLKPHPCLVNLIGKTSLPQLFTLVRRHAKLVVCNNSALLHLAAVLHIPTVSYADPQENITRWGPYPNDGRHIVLQDGKNQKVKPQDFLDAIWKQLTAGPKAIENNPDTPLPSSESAVSQDE